MDTQDQDILLLDYIEGEATPEQIAQVERLMADDPALAARVKAMQTQRDALRTVHDADLPTSRVYEAMAQAQAASAVASAHSRSHWLYRWQPWAIAACLAMTASALWLVIPEGVEPHGSQLAMEQRDFGNEGRTGFSVEDDMAGMESDVLRPMRAMAEATTREQATDARALSSSAPQPAQIPVDERAADTFTHAEKEVSVGALAATRRDQDPSTLRASNQMLQRVEIDVVTDNPALARVDVQNWVLQQQSTQNELFADPEQERIVLRNASQVDELLMHLNTARTNQRAAPSTAHRQMDVRAGAMNKEALKDADDSDLILLEMNYIAMPASE